MTRIKENTSCKGQLLRRFYQSLIETKHLLGWVGKIRLRADDFVESSKFSSRPASDVMLRIFVLKNGNCKQTQLTNILVVSLWKTKRETYCELIIKEHQKKFFVKASLFNGGCSALSFFLSTVNGRFSYIFIANQIMYIS